MSNIILRYVEDKRNHDNYGRSIDYFVFKGNPQLRTNGDIVILTSKGTRDGLFKGIRK